MSKSMVTDEIDFSFCPVCAGILERHPPKLLICKNCDKEFYINARPCNAVIITDNQGRVLLTKRKFDPGMGLWDLPGGFIDLEESAEESVVREMQEELGVKVKNIKYICSGQERYPFKGINYHTVGFVFTAQIENGTPTPQDDVAEFRYFAKEEIPWESLAFPILRKTLEIYYKQSAS